ncbi:MAG: hypothetical protein WAX29_02515 [Propionibacterium sp.]
MRRAVNPSNELLAMAAERDGCLTRVECLSAGMSPSVIDRHREQSWTNVGQGVYALREPDWQTWAWAGVLAAGPGAVIGSEAAAHLDGFAVRPPQRIVVWSPRLVRRPSSSPILFRTGTRRHHGSPPRTMPAESLLDAAWDCSDDELTGLVTAAFSESRTTPERLLEALSQRSRQAHRKLLVTLCTAMPGIESVLESHYLCDVVRAHGLPEGERQAWIDSRRVDCLLRDYGLIVELDSVAHHAGTRLRDMARDNANLVGHDLATLRYGWSDVVGRPCAVAAQLASVLRRRGWRGRSRQCRRCR